MIRYQTYEETWSRFGLRADRSGGVAVRRGPIAIKGLSWGDMDLNGDGHTTVGEFLGAIDVDVRPVQISGKPCREIFRLKDGIPAKELCP